MNSRWCNSWRVGLLLKGLALDWICLHEVKPKCCIPSLPYLTFHRTRVDELSLVIVGSETKLKGWLILKDIMLKVSVQTYP